MAFQEKLAIFSTVEITEELRIGKSESKKKIIVKVKSWSCLSVLSYVVLGKKSRHTRTDRRLLDAC